MALTQISTDGVKDNAVTAGKIPANAVGSSELADNAVDTAAIADQAVTLDKLPHGTGSNDGKFLRANNGADPSFETVTSTNIVNNASGRLVVGSNTANTLDAKSTATYDGTKLFLSGGSGSDGHINMLELKHLNTASSTTNGTGDGPSILLNGYYSSNEWALAKIAADNAGGQYGSGYGGELSFWVHPANGTQTASVIKAADIIGDGSGANLTITNGNLKIGTAGHGIDFHAYATSGNPSSNLLDDYEEGTWTPAPENLSNTPSYYNLTGKYTKVGRLVTIWGMIQVGSTQPTFSSNTLDLHIAGLPFANNATTGYVGGAGPVTFQSWNVFGSTYNNYGAEGTVTCGTVNSTRILFQVNPHSNGGIRGTVRRKALEGGPIITWTMQYQTTA